MSTQRLSLAMIAPALFVLIWSTGWIVAKYSDPHSGPLTFLFVRFVLSVAVFVVLAFVLKSQWPKTRAIWFHAFASGLFLHAIYLGGIWWAIEQGVPASVSGVLAALQPLMTAMTAYWLVGERLTKTQKLGLGIGFLGLIIAIAPGLATLKPHQLLATAIPLVVNAMSMAAVTLGTVYQKRYLQGGNLVTIAAIQYIGAAIFIAPAMILIEPEMMIVWNAHSIGAMIWSVFGLSMGAILLLLYLIGQGQVSRAASLIYLIPPTVAIQAWLLFDETLSLPLIVGTLIVVIGVWMVNTKAKGMLAKPG